MPDKLCPVCNVKMNLRSKNYAMGSPLSFNRFYTDIYSCPQCGRVRLYAANEKVIICFPEKEESEDNILLFLLGILIPHADSFLIAYAIQNKQGAYVIRFELPIGFVSSRKEGYDR